MGLYILLFLDVYVFFIRKSPVTQEIVNIEKPTVINSKKLTLDDLKNVEFYFEQEGQIKLVNGTYQLKPSGSESPADYFVKLDTEHIAFGNLNNYEQDDAAVILKSRSGGSGTFYYLLDVLNPGFGASRAIFLGDRITINSVTIQSQIITIDMITQGPNDGICCATLRKVLQFRDSGQGGLARDYTKYEADTISSLEKNWLSIQALIPFRPGHPMTTVWGGPYTVQFISENNLIVSFEDGYNPGIAILNFTDGKFKILETFKNQGEFTLTDWRNLVNKYGDSRYVTRTYTFSVLRDKEIVSFKELTEVPENEFVQQPYQQTVLQLLKDNLLDPGCSPNKVEGKYASCTVDINDDVEGDWEGTKPSVGWHATVTYDGLYDDSVKALRIEAYIDYDGKWVIRKNYENNYPYAEITGIKKTQQCWPGRGHQDFSSEPCI